MSGYCVCTHGYGQHQTPSEPFRVAGASVGVYATTEAKPLVCCSSECGCESFRKRPSRWAGRRATDTRYGRSRKQCWHGLDGLPVCDKRRSSKPHVRMLDPDYAGWEPSQENRCVGCLRWLAEHPEELEPR